MSTYLALTIGPIYKTLTNARSTKGIWAASYMFSHLIHKIIDGFIKETKSKREFLIPYIEYKPGNETRINWEFSQVKGVGLLPDQIIIQSKEGDFEVIKNVINDVVSSFAQRTAIDLKNHFTRYATQSAQRRKRNYFMDAGLEHKIKTFLNSYFQIYLLEIKNSDSNPVLDIKDILDNLELQSKIPNDETFPYIQDLFENCYYNFMIRQEFTLENCGFPSTVEIATKQFQFKCPDSFKELVKYTIDHNNAYSDSDNNQEEFIELLKKAPFKNECVFKQFHKYIAIIQADGDSIGFLIKQIFNIKKGENALKTFNIFSKQLIQYSKAAVKLIDEYGGTNIYAGGDDLLFFAPVMTDNGSNSQSAHSQHIFGLIDKIDNCFKQFINDCPQLKDLIDECIKNNKRPAMSYGISISYYKYPMNEALINAYDLLFHVAKKTRNTIAFRVMKHSGQYFGTSFSKTHNAYLSFINLIENHLIDESFLASVMYKLEEHKVILQEISSFMPNHDDDTPYNRLLQFFKNNFDEKIHNADDKQLFLHSVRHLVREVFTEEIDIDSKMHKIYSSLRFVNFLKADDK
jgi:CRISPR-associated protein Cmr2